MLSLKIVTYTPDLINQTEVNSITLLTKEGHQMSILTGKEYGNVLEHVATYDASLKTIIVEHPVIDGTAEYDEAAMLDMFDGAAILYGDMLYNGGTLFVDDIWVQEIALRNDDRYAFIPDAVYRNFWNHAFDYFKAQQRSVKRHFDFCFNKAMEEYRFYNQETAAAESDVEKALPLAKAIAHDLWEVYDKVRRSEMRKYI